MEPSIKIKGRILQSETEAEFDPIKYFQIVVWKHIQKKLNYTTVTESEII